MGIWVPQHMDNGHLGAMTKSNGHLGAIINGNGHLDSITYGLWAFGFHYVRVMGIWVPLRTGNLLTT